MQLGFNTNFRHRGVLFHVQTEDSGLENPHVITHLFHGGNIMSSEKRDYSELLAEGGDLEAQVRALMESQHKKMLKALSAGVHDETIRQRVGADVFEQTDSRILDVTDVTDAGVPDDAASSTDSTAATAATPVESPATAPPQAASPGAASPKERIARAFGDGVVSNKPLDEVVLDFLVQNARKRKQRAKG